MPQKEKIVLIDGHSILNRTFYGLPMLTNSEGLHTNAVYGFLNILFKVLDEEQAQYVAVAFDLKEPTFRHKMYDGYKGTRKPMPQELHQQVPLMKEMLQAMGIPVMQLAGYEADDILGTVSRQMERQGLEVSILSGDRDLLQLATEDIQIRIPRTKATGTEIENYYAADVAARYQVTPEQFIDVKALMGDASDNIPGVPGIGEKTATKLIVQYGSIENAHAHVEEITPARAREALKAHYDMAEMSKTLATIVLDAPFELDQTAARIENLYTQEALELCRRLEFRNLLGRFQIQEEQPVQEEIYRRITDRTEAERVLAGLQGQRTAFQMLWEGGRLLGAALAVSEQEACFLEAGSGLSATYICQTVSDLCGHAERLTTMHLKEQLVAGQMYGCPGDGQRTADSQQQFTMDQSGDGQLNFNQLLIEQPEEAQSTATGQGTRQDAQSASAKTASVMPGDTSSGRQSGLALRILPEYRGRVLDLAIGAYLVNPLKDAYDCADISREYLNQTTPSQAELFGKDPLSRVMKEKPEQFLNYVCRQTLILYRACDPMEQRLRELSMWELFEKIEMPLVYTLADMEQEGIRVQAEELKHYGAQLTGRIRELEQLIHQAAGEEFNINSPKQLGVILFEKLQLPHGKKTRTGYSTAADVLEKLAAEYPIVSDILEYRQMTKLKSTYADGLANFISEDGRIHGKFHQTITATGRISSTEPNLQNIPIRMELGRLIRKVFVPDPGYVFLDADYSQIELRVLAHLSGDEKLIQAYRDAADIHTITASQVFHVAPEDVTPLLRRNAKAVNFGIVYGISSFGLSQDLSITRKEAQEYIEQYFHTYPGIREFLDRTVADARANGYVTTMFGRRRPMPELTSSNFMQRSFGERVAMNAPIQGAAADIIKIAMNRVNDQLRSRFMKSRLILQVHDELLVEAAVEEADEVREMMVREMQNAADLKVQLEVDIHSGANWYEAK